MNSIKRFINDESGATAIEYGLIAAGVGVAISTIVFTLGDELRSMFTDVNKAIEGRSAK